MDFTLRGSGGWVQRPALTITRLRSFLQHTPQGPMPGLPTENKKLRVSKHWKENVMAVGDVRPKSNQEGGIVTSRWLLTAHGELLGRGSWY